MSLQFYLFIVLAIQLQYKYVDAFFAGHLTSSNNLLKSVSLQHNNNRNDCYDTIIEERMIGRRDWIRKQQHTVTAAMMLGTTTCTDKVNAANPLPLEGRNAQVTRVEEIGGGFDLLSPPTIPTKDVYYPKSMSANLWRVQRIITNIEGDIGQANIVWQSLGGGNNKDVFNKQQTEVYESKFIIPNYNSNNCILDRAYELASRNPDSSLSIDSYNPEISPNDLSYTRRGSNSGSVSWKIVQRTVEPITDLGFGSDELYRIEESTTFGSKLDSKWSSKARTKYVYWPSFSFRASIGCRFP